MKSPPSLWMVLIAGGLLGLALTAMGHPPEKRLIYCDLTNWSPTVNFTDGARLSTTDEGDTDKKVPALKVYDDDRCSEPTKYYLPNITTYLVPPGKWCINMFTDHHIKSLHTRRGAPERNNRWEVYPCSNCDCKAQFLPDTDEVCVVMEGGTFDYFLGRIWSLKHEGT